MICSEPKYFLNNDIVIRKKDVNMRENNPFSYFYMSVQQVDRSIVGWNFKIKVRFMDWTNYSISRNGENK